MPYSSHGDTIRRLALLLGLCAMGCVQYVPTSADTIAPARELRILLTESAQAVLAPRIGVRVVALEATVDAVEADSLRLRVRGTVDPIGITTAWHGETLVIPSSFVSGVRTRQLSRTRSWLFAAALLGGGTALAATFSGDAFTSNRAGGGQAPAR